MEFWVPFSAGQVALGPMLHWPSGVAYNPAVSVITLRAEDYSKCIVLEGIGMFCWRLGIQANACNEANCQ